MAKKKLSKTPKSTKAKKTKPTADAKSRLVLAMRDFVRTRGLEYLKDKNISSIGIGYKVKDGKLTKDISIQFTVAQKVKPEQIESLDSTIIPDSFKIGGKTIPTDVIQREFSVEFKIVVETASNDRKTQLNPIVPGISVANFRETAGTIGCIVYDAKDGTPHILSNWHVLHGPNGVIGDDVVQPGPYDDNRIQQNKLGKLIRSHLGHAGDCAIASIENRKFDRKIFELGTTVERLGEPELGDKVVKSGRTTGVTHGIVTRIHTIAKIDYGGSTGETEVGGFEIGVDPNKVPDNGEISMGGDSGSVWLFRNASGKPSDVLAGLHFAGESSGDPNEHAVACYPKSIFEKLDILPAPATVATAAKIAKQTAAKGYDAEFLGLTIAPPALTAKSKRSAFSLNGSNIVDYTHFSLALNKDRQLAIWVGWNIDGQSLRKLSRKGIPFILDPDIPSEFQAGEELYAGNRLDRGHIARRADLLWGPLGDAKAANIDSFYFTNITPQMDNFNQSGQAGIWGELENAVFEDTNVEDLKVSVFGGPTFQDDDKEYRDVLLPREYWKIIVFVEQGKLKAKGFLLTQNLDQLEALELDEFKVYQVSIGEIEARNGLVFDAALKAGDSIGERIARKAEALGERKYLLSTREIDWS